MQRNASIGIFLGRTKIHCCYKETTMVAILVMASSSMANGWHSHIFCTPNLILGQDESQVSTSKIADGPTSNCLLAGQDSTLHYK